MNNLSKNSTGCFLNFLVIGYKAPHITDSSDLTLYTHSATHSERQRRVVPERERETKRGQRNEQREREGHFYRGQPTAANYTENKHIDKRTLSFRRRLVRLVMEK